MLENTIALALALFVVCIEIMDKLEKRRIQRLFDSLDEVTV